MTLAPRVVVIHRRTELDELLARHGTRAQVAFFLQSRGRGIEEVEARDRAVHYALATVSSGIPLEWRRGRLASRRSQPRAESESRRAGSASTRSGRRPASRVGRSERG